MKEKATDARFIGATVKIEVCRKVEKAFRRKPDDSLSTIYARALEEVSRDVELTAEDYAAIEAETRRNEEARARKRAKSPSKANH
jgi:hypothetical protein